MTRIELSSPAFQDNAPLPDRFAKDHEDLSPPLSWSHVPDETVELVVTCEDPDAPSGTWVHWLVAGIDPTSTGLEEGKLPAGSVAGTSSYGDTGYGGPQPPVGDSAHRYFFRVLACRRSLGMAEGFDGDELRAALDGVEIAKGTIVGTYQR